jgi:predicted dehydrogenase
MGKDVRVGVVGAGHLGTLHAKMLADLPGVRLAGVVDVVRERAERAASVHRVPVFGTLAALLPESDAVTVATPTSTHFEVGAEILSSGRHLFIEKPVTETVKEADALCSLARERGLVLQVGHIERFNPAILALEHYEIKPLFVESHRLAQFNPRGTDVAVVLDLMIHDIDLILSFVHSPIRNVEASGVAVVSDSLDIANARIQFLNGCVANVTASRISQRRMRKMRLFQPNTYISIDFSEPMAEVFRLVTEGEPSGPGALMLGELGTGSRKRKILYEQPEVKEVNALRHELGLFVECVRSNTVPLVSGEDGRRALEVANSIMQKISQQQVSLE